MQNHGQISYNQDTLAALSISKSPFLNPTRIIYFQNQTHNCRLSKTYNHHHQKQAKDLGIDHTKFWEKHVKHGSATWRFIFSNYSSMIHVFLTLTQTHKNPSKHRDTTFQHSNEPRKKRTT